MSQTSTTELPQIKSRASRTDLLGTRLSLCVVKSRVDHERAVPVRSDAAGARLWRLFAHSFLLAIAWGLMATEVRAYECDATQSPDYCQPVAQVSVWLHFLC